MDTPEINYNDYFNNRITQEIEKENLEGKSSKFQALQEASQEKIRKLAELQTKQEKIEAVNNQSLVGRIGLGQTGTVAGMLNLGVASVAAPIGMLGEAGAFALEGAASFREGSSNEQTKAQAQSLKDLAKTLRKNTNLDDQIMINPETGESTSSLQRRLAGDLAVSLVQGSVAAVEGVTGLASMVSGGAAGKALEQAGFRPHEAQTILEEYLSPEMRRANQQVEAVNGFTNTVEAMLDNPSTIPQAIAKSLPSMFVGGAIGKGIGLIPKVAPGIAGALGEGTIMAGSQAEAIRNETEDKRLTLKQALLAAGTGVMGAGVARLGGTVAGKLKVGDIDEAMVSGTLGKARHSLPVNVALTGGIEGTEELLQSAGEQVAQNIALDRPFDQNVGDAAAMGLLTGAPIGGMTGLGQKARDKAEKQVQEQRDTTSLQASIASGDVSAYIDPSKPSYAPEKAIAALFGNSQLPTATPETKQVNLTKANEIVAELVERHAAKQEELSITSVEGIKEVIAANQAALATMDPEDTHAQNLQKKIAFLEGEANFLTTNPVPKKDIAVLQKQFAAMDRQLNAAQEVLSTFTMDSQAKDLDVDAEIAIINEPVNETDVPAMVVAKQAAAERVINLSMVFPERLDAQDASALADNKSNALTEPQREYLRAFSAARLYEHSQKTADDVAADIYTGTKNYRGIFQHRELIGGALAAGNKKLATSYLTTLTNFMKGHQAKADIAAQSFEELQRTGKAVQFLKNQKTKKWFINRNAHLSFTKVAENGGMTIHMGTPIGQITRIQTEADAIAKAVKEMEAAYALKFATPVSKGSSDVQNSPQPQKVSSDTAPYSSGVSTPEVEKNSADQVERRTGVVGSTATREAAVDIGGTTQYAAKDQAKSDKANKFIGRGSKESSTAKYAAAWGDRANVGKYTAKDIVFVSAEGQRKGRIAVDLTELTKATSAGATIITDVAADRNRSYNSGEREVAAFLESVGYVETSPGTWNAGTVVDEEANASSVSTASTGKTEDTDSQLQSAEEDATTTTVVPTPVATEDLAETVEQTAEVEEEATVTDPVDSETLSTMTQESPEGTPHNEKKLGDFFSQSAGKDTDETKRPLVSIDNFVSAVANGSVNLSDYIKNLDRNAVPAVWNTFNKKLAEWSPVITRNLRKDVPIKYNYIDPIRYLTSSNDVSENVKAAITTAIFSYVANQANRPEINDDKAINGILSRSKDSPVSSDARALLETVGVYQSQAVDSLGSTVIDALGFKLKPTAPKDMLAKMRVSLGAHALKVMEDVGLIERTEIANGDMKALRGEDLYSDIDSSNEVEQQYSAESVRKGHHFFKISRDPTGTLTTRVSTIADSIHDSQNFIQNLFGVEASQVFPTLVPSKNIQKKTDTGMGVPAFIKKVFKKNQQRPWKINKDPVNVLSAFSEEEALEMLGVELEIKHTHVRNLNSKRAKYSGLRREYQSFVEFLGNLVTKENGIDQEFYLDQELWKQQRSGYTNNTINPNTGKGIRWLIAADSWTTNIQLSNEEQVKSFMIRTSEGFGIRPEKADSQKAVDTLKFMVQEPVVAKAIKTIQLVIFADTIALSDEQKKDIKEAVKLGKQKLHTLASLVAYARYQQAIDTEAEAFSTNIMGEVDGVSNGSILNSIIYGAAATASELNSLLEKGGIYTLASSFRKYNLWRGTPGNQDIYETNAQDLHADVNQLPAELQRITAAIWATAGSPIDAAMEATKEGRDLLKGPINPLNYGGGFKSIIGKMAYNYVDTLYERLEEFSRKGTDPDTINNFITNVNTLLKQGKAPQIPVDKPIGFYLGYTMSKQQESALRIAYSDTIGETTKTVIGRNFEQFLRRSRTVTKTVNLAYGLYDAVYKAARETMIKELGIPTNKSGPIHDLTTEQEMLLEERLKDIKPIMHTAMSKAEGKSENGILLAKSKRQQNDAASYEVEVTFGSKLKNGARQMTVKGRSVIQDAPGVVAISGTTHALDSYNSHLVQEVIHVVNNHDAVGAGINELSKAAELLNKATWTNTLNYSPLSEAHDALMRVVSGIVAMDQRGELTPEMKQAVNMVLSDLTKKAKLKNAAIYLDEAVGNVFFESLEANRIKYEALSQWAVVDQYAMDGGSYGVTDADRQEALDRLNSAPSVPTTENTQALRNFATIIFGEQVSQTKPEVKETKQSKAITANPFGSIGNPTIQSDPDLVAFFEANTDVDAQRVIKELYRKLSEAPESRTKAFNLKLLKLLSKTVNPALKMRYVTPATAEGQVLEKPVTKSRGWYVSKGTQEEVYLLSPDFVHSGLTAETLLHELTHSALARTVESATGEAKELVDELEVLRSRAAAYVKEKGLKQYAPAVGSVQELIAWGMTNQGFQKDVLNAVQVETKTGSNTLISGMKKFIESIVGLLFKGSSKSEQEQTISGMTVLVSNVSGLFYQAAQTKTTADLVLAQETTVVEAIHAYSTLDIHEALGDGSIDPDFDNHLRGLLQGIVQKLHGPFGSFKESLMKNQANSPMDVWMKALDTGKAPFATLVNSNMAVTSQEAFAIEQIEATVKAALDGNESLTKMAYKELSKLYMEAYKLLKPSDFNSQDEYNFIFKMESDNGDRSDYLARFAALGLAHQGFNKLLKVATERDTRRIKDVGTFAERIQLIFERVLEFFQKKITHTFDGQQADEKLAALVDQLVDIEAKKRFTLSRRATETNFLAPIENGVKATTEAMRKKIGEIAGSEFVRNNTSGFVRGAGGAARTISNDRVDQFLNGVAILRDRHFKGVPGLAAGMVNTLRGPLEQFQELLRMTKNHERERKAIISNRAALALSTFIDGGKNLSKEAKASISSVFMRTGAHNLIGHFSLAEIETLVSNRASLMKGIKTFEDKLSGPLKNKYIEQINILGHYKASGLTSGLLMMNAHLIARLAGTKYETGISQEQATQTEETIKVLSTLYALKYTAESELYQAKEVIRTENQRSDGNGVEFVLELHKRLEQESLEKLFKGNPALMIHGFTPDIVNPNTDIKIANKVDGKDLINQGYSEGAVVPNDAADPDTAVKRIYVLKDGGLAPWLTGVFSLSSMQSKGTKKHDGYVNTSTATGAVNASMQAAITNQKLANLVTNKDPRRDLSKETENHMAPIYNEQGQIVNWRYLMQEKTKNNLLERDNAFERILGVLAGSIYDKQTTQEQNKKAIQALYEQYQEGYAGRAESYMLVGPKSTNRELRQIWHLLPDATKKDVRAVWGYDGMMVRSDSLDIMFGYRKLSMADMFKKDPKARNELEKLFVGFMEFNLTLYGKVFHGLSGKDAENYAKRAAVVVTRGERAWMELVAETKDIIVVKTGLVMLGNIYSNLSLLWLHGVPWKDMAHHHLVALKGATAYQQDSTELAKYQTLLDTGYTQGNEAEIQRNIVRLKDALARNPVGKLIDAGLMPTIVEDIAADADIYSYKSKLVRDTERFTNALHPSIKAVGRAIYMTHDTKMYQGLSRITQLSDFVARYTLYQHLISQKENPLSEKDAIQEASDSFVNYDIPLHRKMQFTDDLGLMMFTKYFLQIQRVLLKMGKDHPARMILSMVLGNFMDLGPIVLEGSMLTRIGNNPFGVGALNFPGTLDELATVNSALAVIK